MDINLCCGSHLIPGWLNLDKYCTKFEGAQYWELDQPIPVDDCSADIVLISHSLIYAEMSWYLPLFKEVWRVLKHGGRFLIKEDDNEKRVWMKIGKKHASGLIRSNSNPKDVVPLLKECGFIVMNRYLTCDEELFVTHKRARDYTYILTCFKEMGLFGVVGCTWQPYEQQ